MADDLTKVELRPSTPEDRELLLRLYATTREDELRPVPWSEAEKRAFVEMQFAAQDRAYREAYPDGEFLVVLVAGLSVGRLYLARLPTEVRLVDLTLEPGYRGRGIGTRLLAGVIARAERDGLDVTLHVEPWNPARRLYERLGFASVEVRGMYEFMRRPAGSRAAEAPPAPSGTGAAVS